MGKHTSKAKDHGKNGMKALKSDVGEKTATRARKTNIKYSDDLSMENWQDLNQKASAHVNVSYLELRSRRLKKIIQRTKDYHVSTTPTPPKLRLASMDGDISRNVSYLALPQISQNVCLSNGEASCDQVRDSMEMQTHAEKRNHFLCSEDCVVYCVHPRSAEMEASTEVNGKQVDQDIVSLRRSQMIHTTKQKREATIPYRPCAHANSNADQITNQVSGTDPDERATRDQRVSICICKTNLFGAPNSRAEVEEFFVEAEQYEQKLLTERYNFDFLNDIPLKGRYEWINLTHS